MGSEDSVLTDQRFGLVLNHKTGFQIRVYIYVQGVGWRRSRVEEHLGIVVLKVERKPQEKLVSPNEIANELASNKWPTFSNNK